MGKKFLIVILLLVVICSSAFFIKKYNDNQKIKNEIEAQEELNKQGVVLVLLAGSNYESKGKLNSEGYLLKTRNGEIIVVDGGRYTDAEELSFYIKKFGNGKVDHWYLTHGHNDHVGALNEILNNDAYKDIKIKNIYHTLLSDEWYKANDKRGYESEHSILMALEEHKDRYENVIIPKKGEIYSHDNVKSHILRVADPEVTNSDNGNDSGLVWKFEFTDVNKSMIFLGDAFLAISKELLENPEVLKADYVQMAHHGQSGVTQEVYQAIKPSVCFYNCPEWLYNNDIGTGYNSGPWKSVEVRKWMEEIGVKESYKAFEGTQIFKINSNGLEKRSLDNI